MKDTKSWQYPGPSVSVQDVHAFGRELGMAIPEDVVWFLTEIGNGGRPDPEVVFDFVEDGRPEGAIVHGLLGINHPDQNYDLGSDLRSDVFSIIFNKAFPLGFDTGNNCFMYIFAGPDAGQVHFVAFDEFAVRDKSPRTWKICNSIQEFAAHIQAAMGD